MPQVTLHHYNYPIKTTSSRKHTNPLPTHPFPLLSLPLSIRRRIYIFAGLFSGCKIHFNYEPPDDDEQVSTSARDPFCTQFLSNPNLEEIPQNDHIRPRSEQLSHFIEGPLPYPKIMLDRDVWVGGRDPECVYDPNIYYPESLALPIQLLYVSQQVSVEVKKIFWSENYFSISQPEIGGLSFLESISPKCLRDMTSLSIRLNFWGHKWLVNRGRERPPEKAPCHPGCPSYGWHDKIGVPRTKKQKASMKEWTRVCSRLSKFITPRHFQLWIFCDVSDEDSGRLLLEPLSQLPILRDCGIRLSHDPAAIKLHELARSTALRLTSPRPINDSTFPFMDLPFELKTKILRYTPLISSTELIWSQGIQGNRALFSQRTPTMTDLQSSDQHRSTCCEHCRNEEEICYCSSKHSAYSTTCKCWHFPSELFSVSHAFRSLVIPMFYAKNRFIIPGALFVGYYAFPNKRSPFDFFKRIPLDARQHLKHLRLITDWKQSKETYWEWMKIVDFCADQLNLSRLTFVVDMSWNDRKRHLWPVYYGAPDREEQLRERSTDQWKAMLQMAESMGRYKGWKDVFWHLSYQGENQFPGNRKRMEAILEKVVQGRNYDSLSRGKVYRECDCKVIWSDVLCNRHADYWEEVYQDDPDYVFISSPVLKRKDNC